jgi:hypothetical protein
MATIRYKLGNLDAAGQIVITSRGFLIANALPPVHDLEIPQSDRGQALSAPLSYEPKGLFFELPLNCRVGEARLRASLRPPLKLHVRISRMQLSRRLSDAEMQEKV